ncbi:hypothetical protein SAMN05216215_100310 [Saccharopolyspora shandongensis]|uniref:Uncharacterized protein n=1 Tax=Saccharopolyspora shandongensis TaxID=418495 RepID=A0A1H2T8C0_9PSEU|nr:hypothetical protein [Saccharopolyspora shandongensis]SDW39534.1 hypothetical protein SAMN05216215_100310 [Saccharopolyspora shandongensis]
MYALFATGDPSQHIPGSLVHAFGHDFLLSWAIATGLVAAISIACVLIILAGLSIGVLVVRGIRGLIRLYTGRACPRHSLEYAQLITVHTDGVATTVINLDHYRRQRQHRHEVTQITTHEAANHPEPGDDPA